MSKKAILVTFSATTRIIVDGLPEDVSDIDDMIDVIGEQAGELADKARNKIRQDLENYLFADNMEIRLDNEVPAGSDDESDIVIKPSGDKKFSVAVTLPLSLWVDVRARDEEQAREKALKTALNTPYEEWGDDFSTASADIVKD